MTLGMYGEGGTIVESTRKLDILPLEPFLKERKTGEKAMHLGSERKK